MSSQSATCLSNSRNDHRAYPGGGTEQARAINRASTSPVTEDGTGGSARLRRPTTSSTRPADSVNRLATRYTVPSETPTRSATTRRSGAGPSASSNANRILARVIIRAGRVPLDTNRVNHTRSAAVNVTTCPFDLGIPIDSSQSSITGNSQPPIPTYLNATLY
jgi:hypothetical protein